MANFNNAEASFEAFSPADSTFGFPTFRDAAWEIGEANTPEIFRSPDLQTDNYDEHDDDDILFGIPADTTAYGHNTEVPLEEQSMFPPMGTQDNRYRQGPVDERKGIEPFPELEQPNDVSLTWNFGGSSISDRLYQPTQDLFQRSLPPQLDQIPIISAQDLQNAHARVHPANGQDIRAEIGDLVFKVHSQGYNIQSTPLQHPMDGLTALGRGLNALITPLGLRALSHGEIQSLVAQGTPGDPQTNGNGYVIGHLTAEHLQTALDRYGRRNNAVYQLGIVRSMSSLLNFEVSVLSSPASRRGQTTDIVWVYQDLSKYNPLSGFYEPRWAAIAPSNTDNVTKTFTQAIQSPPPRPLQKEAHTPLNKELLHVGHKSTGSLQSALPSGASTSSLESLARLSSSRIDKQQRLHPSDKQARPTTTVTTISTDKPYPCELCGQGFLWQKDLNRHMPKHNGKRDFVCPVVGCPRAYTRRDNMARHHDSAHPTYPPLSTKSRSSGNSISSPRC